MINHNYEPVCVDVQEIISAIARVNHHQRESDPSDRIRMNRSRMNHIRSILAHSSSPLFGAADMRMCDWWHEARGHRVEGNRIYWLPLSLVVNRGHGQYFAVVAVEWQ